MKTKINFSHNYNGQLLNFKNIGINVGSMGSSSSTYTWVSMSGVSSVIRQFMKQVFPDVKFQIKSESFAGGDSVRIYLLNNLDRKREINEVLTTMFEGGRFDGMTDYYEYNTSDVLSTEYNGQQIQFYTKYLFVEDRPKWGTKEYYQWLEQNPNGF